jgi:hypothetical protein
VSATCETRGMTNTSIQNLEKEIEQLVRKHVEACEIAAAAAVQRAFGAARTSRSRVQRPASRKRSVPKPGTMNNRRSAAELAKLGERLYAAVCDKPGETMHVIAAEVGASPRELQRPMFLLKQAGTVRSAGQRSFTRYFPMAAPSATT